MRLRIRKTQFILFATLLLAALLVVVPAAGSASAHDQLIDSSPQPGEELEESPGEATLQFSAEVIEIGAELALQGADGEVIPFEEELSISYDTITQPLPALEAGEYALNWRVVSQDGHPISGTIDFVVAGGGAPAETGGSFGNSSQEPSFEAGPAQDAAEDEGGRFDPTPIIGIIGIVVVGTIIVFAIRRLSKPSSPNEDEDASGTES